MMTLSGYVYVSFRNAISRLMLSYFAIACKASNHPTNPLPMYLVSECRYHHLFDFFS